MPKFYFTYGRKGQPFCGGWTEVEAPDKPTAHFLFRTYHPDKVKGLLNCNHVFSEDQFKRTLMCVEGNFGHRCHETITLQRELTDERRIH